METRTADVFRGVVEGVLERFAFILAEADSDGAPGAEWGKRAGEYLHVSIAFSGPSEGVVNLTAPDGLCRQLAANVLGGEPDEMTGEQAGDALKELANVICGELIECLFGTDSVFHLTIPMLMRVDEGKWRELMADSAALRLVVEDSVLLANLVLVRE
jgi:CheY-specific phosphatase CheX